MNATNRKDREPGVEQDVRETKEDSEHWKGEGMETESERGREEDRGLVPGPGVWLLHALPFYRPETKIPPPSCPIWSQSLHSTDESRT